MNETNQLTGQLSGRPDNFSVASVSSVLRIFP